MTQPVSLPTHVMGAIVTSRASVHYDLVISATQPLHVEKQRAHKCISWQSSPPISPGLAAWALVVPDPDMPNGSNLRTVVAPKSRALFTTTCLPR